MQVGTNAVVNRQSQVGSVNVHVYVRGNTDCIDVELFFFFQAEDGIRDLTVTGVQTCALPISRSSFKRTSTKTSSSTRPPAATSSETERRAPARSSRRASPANSSTKRSTRRS